MNKTGPMQNKERGNIRHIKRKKAMPKPNLSRNEKEIRRYFEGRVAGLDVVKTTKTPSGQLLDWIKIESQLPTGQIASPPPGVDQLVYTRGKLNDQLVRFELEKSKVDRGPEGTVPILRKDLKKLRFTKSLNDHLSKHGHKTYSMQINENDSIEVPGDGAHDYSYTAQFVTCYGGEGYFSAYDPYLQWSDEFSLLQILMRRGNQTVESGWQEYRDLYGDWVPHLFVYYTTNGYSADGDNIGGYNRDVDGWIQYSSSIYPGAVSSPNSVRGGGQYVMFIKYQLYQGNWWLNCNNNWIGYYPASLFSNEGLNLQAGKIAFYGEIVDSSDHGSLTNTDMGSGYWPEYQWPWAAYMRNLRYQSDTNGGMSQYNADTVFASDQDLYDIENHMNSGTTWNSYFWLGGPGAG
ncbi:MAG: neprosin family prolyl endopeptidase [Nitrososphaeraceae archaeon]